MLRFGGQHLGRGVACDLLLLLLLGKCLRFVLLPVRRGELFDSRRERRGRRRARLQLEPIVALRRLRRLVAADLELWRRATLCGQLALLQLEALLVVVLVLVPEHVARALLVAVGAVSLFARNHVAASADRAVGRATAAAAARAPLQVSARNKWQRLAQREEARLLCGCSGGNGVSNRNAAKNCKPNDDLQLARDKVSCLTFLSLSLESSSSSSAATLLLLITVFFCSFSGWLLFRAIALVCCTRNVLCLFVGNSVCSGLFLADFFLASSSQTFPSTCCLLFGPKLGILSDKVRAIGVGGDNNKSGCSSRRAAPRSSALQTCAISAKERRTKTINSVVATRPAAACSVAVGCSASALQTGCRLLFACSDSSCCSRKYTN